MAAAAPLTAPELADLEVWADAHAPRAARRELRMLLAEVHRLRAVNAVLTEQVSYQSAHVEAMGASQTDGAELGVSR
jgi:hypothetical protein